MDIERQSVSGFDRFSTQFGLAPLTLKLFAILFVLADLVALVISPSPGLGVGAIVAVAAVFGIITAIWVVWFGVGMLLLISIAIDAISGGPWYEIAWALLALTLLCWPSSWAYIISGGVTKGSPSAEK